MIKVTSGVSRFSVLAALAMAVVLPGCGDFDPSQPWFRKPMMLFGQTGGYTFSDVQEERRAQPITPADLIDANGSCPAPPAPPQQPVAVNQPGSPAAMPLAAPDSGTLLGEGVSLGMSECDVVYRAGAPGKVEIGKNPNGVRTAVLTFPSGPRAGVYRFEAGRLMEMDAVAQPEAPAPKVAKKKPVKPKQSAKTNDAT